MEGRLLGNMDSYRVRTGLVLEKLTKGKVDY